MRYTESKEYWPVLIRPFMAGYELTRDRHPAACVRRRSLEPVRTMRINAVREKRDSLLDVSSQPEHPVGMDF